MSKIVKSVGKTVKGHFKNLKKGFKKLTSSKFGKALLIGAAVFTGGAALGLWSSPFASLNGILASGGATSGGAAAGTLPSLSQIGSGAGMMGGGAAGGSAVGAGTVLAPSTTAAAGSAASSAGMMSKIGSAIKGTAKFAKANPLMTTAAVSGVSSMMAPDEIDIMREKQKQKQNYIDRINQQNYNISGSTAGIINPLFSQQSGMMNRRYS